jgi:hypothetical protein
MPRDTPPATRKPKPQMQAVVTRDATPPPTRPKPVEKVPEPVVVKGGPSDSVEEAFLRAGATVIEAAPVLRDFQKEAVSFVPSIVKRRPPQKKANKVEDVTKVETMDGVTDGAATGEGGMKVEKSFLTTVEDGEEDESVGARQSPPAEQKPATPVSMVAKPAIPETLKRPLEQDKKPTETPPVTAPKRRRMVNAAPDV